MGPAWLHLPLLKQRELFLQIEVLGCQFAARPHTEHEEMGEIVRYGRQRGEGSVNGRKMEPGMDMND